MKLLDTRWNVVRMSKAKKRWVATIEIDVDAESESEALHAIEFLLYPCDCRVVEVRAQRKRAVVTPYLTSEAT